MMIRSITTMRRAPKGTPTPIATLATVDNEDGGLEGEGLGEEDVAERLFGPTSWLVLGVVCKAKDDVGEEVREGVMLAILALAVEVDKAVGVYGVRLKGTAFIESAAVPHP
jgi:hypothetical protein